MGKNMEIYTWLMYDDDSSMDEIKCVKYVLLKILLGIHICNQMLHIQV